MKKITKFLSAYSASIVIIFSISVSVLAFIFYYQHGLITAYADSKGHLDIARRVFDSPTPGLAQLGGYWLPLLHILMLPTIWNNFFWQTGIAGSMPSMLCFIFSIYYIYKFSIELSGSKLSVEIVIKYGSRNRSTDTWQRSLWRSAEHHLLPEQPGC